MKHQIFFFLSLFSLSVYSMENELVEIELPNNTFADIWKSCEIVNYYCPSTFDMRALKQNRKDIKKLPKSEQDKILKEARKYIPQKIEISKEVVKFILNECDYEHESENKVY
jgi:hypothetical protein